MREEEVRNRWIRRQVNMVDCKDVVFGVGAELDFVRSKLATIIRVLLTFSGFLPGTENLSSFAITF